MSTTVSLAGVNYSIPSEGDGNYASDLTAYFVALANNTKVFQASSSNFPLQQETSFGTNYGLKVAYIKSQATNPASTGIVRLGNTESLSWRNAANSSDLALKVNASDVLEFNGTSISIGGSVVQTEITVSDTSTVDLTLSSNDISGSIKSGSIENSHISALAAIAYSKLNLSGSLVNADISNSAAIAYSKLALTGSLLNADINASAAIALSKLAAVTASKALVSDSSGFVSASSVTATELGYVSGVTSAIQTQIDSKQAAATAVTLAGTQTLTNKTLTSPAITTPTGIVKGDVGLGNVDNTSDATKNAATATLTNKTIGDAPTFTQVATPSTPAAGFNKIYPKSDGNFYTLDSNGIETQVGSGAGGGAKNYLGTVNNINGNGNFELGATTGWSLSHTTLSSLVPNQASGSWTAASGNLSISAVTSGKLAGSYSLSMVSSAASTAGDMLVSDAFTIDTEDQAKVLTFKAYYSATSGASNLNFSGTSANTHQIYIYDVTNSAWIQPAGVYGMTQGSGVGYVTGTFQSTSNSTQYRLAVVNVNASAGAFTILMDDFSVGPQTAPIGAVVTDWVSYTPTMTGAFGSISATLTGRYRRVGDSIELEVYYTYTSGTGSAADFNFSIPTGMTLDTNKISSTAIALGSGYYFNNAVGFKSTEVRYHSTASIKLTKDSATGFWQGTDMDEAGTAFAIRATLPISGWSSNVQMSNDTDTRVVAGRFYRNGNTTYNQNAARQQILIDTAVVDTHGMLSGNTVVIPVSGTYRLSAEAYFSGANISASGDYSVLVTSGSVAGTILVGRAQRAVGAGTATSVNTSGVYNLTAGTVLYLVVSSTINHSASTITVDGTTNYLTMLNVERLSGPATVAASEQVSAKYSSSVASTLNGAVIKDYATKLWDTHNAVTTGASWKFTAPISGKYAVIAKLETATLSWTAGQQVNIVLYKNGSAHESIHRQSIPSTNSLAYFLSGSTTVDLLAGEYIDVRSDSSVAGNTGSTASNQTVSITLMK